MPRHHRKETKLYYRNKVIFYDIFFGFLGEYMIDCDIIARLRQVNRFFKKRIDKIIDQNYFLLRLNLEKARFRIRNRKTPYIIPPYPTIPVNYRIEYIYEELLKSIKNFLVYNELYLITIEHVYNISSHWIGNELITPHHVNEIEEIKRFLYHSIRQRGQKDGLPAFKIKIRFPLILLQI